MMRVNVTAPHSTNLRCVNDRLRGRRHSSPMDHILLTYYSRTGNTERVAEEIATACHATVEKLQETRWRSGFLAYLRSGREAWKKIAAPIQPTKEDPTHFDVVALGTPVWAGHLASPMRTYVEAHARKSRQVAFFCTQGGAGADKVFRDMAALCGTEPVATLVVTEKELKTGAYRDRLALFAKALSDAANVEEPADLLRSA